MKKLIIVFVLLLSALSCFSQIEFSTCLFDASRNRVIPLAVYQPHKVNSKTKVIIFSHGYDGNKNNKSNQTYAYLTRFLSQKGFYVISIQHESPTDPMLAMSGNFMETRMPNWERGVENIRFTINEFKKLKPEMKWNDLSIIGHSNGGDMAMLFAAKYPEIAHKVISLDHRRMIMPRCSTPEIYTLRGSDYEADEKVIPTFEEQQKYHITVIKLDGITHGDMDHKGTKEQHEQMLRHLYDFLK